VPRPGGRPEELSATSATETADKATETDEGTPDPAAPAARRRRRLITVLAALTILALAAAIGTGYYWYSGTLSDNAKAAAMRDEAVDAAEQIVVNINTVRPASLDADLNAAESSLTEPMLTQYRQVRQKFAENLRQAQAEVVATPVSAALTALDPEKATASAIVAIDVNARSATAQPQSKQQLFLVEMIRTPDGWKAAKATPSTGQQ
jgi:Mce-associated membrane protein